MKRMRVFAGPNGSGKTTLVNQFIKERSKLINPDHHINPDSLNLIDVLDFNNFGLKVDESDFRDFISQSPFYDDCNIDIKDLKVNDNSFKITYETVLSHSSKVDFLKNAKNCGWQVYLYFVSTVDSYINCGRVEERVLKGEHDVPPDKIQDRYMRSHDNLFASLQHCRRAYIFDNSIQMQLIAEKKSDNSLTLSNEDSIPAWLDECVLSKIK